MKISLKWLQDYIDVQEFFSKPDELGEILTHGGLELENIQRESERLDSVVVGHICSLEQHPQADRLTLCQVDVGEKNLRPIICGATNHKQGDKVVVALPGAKLSCGLHIKKSKIRGIESLGMLCSESELGFTEKSEGICILPSEAPVGTSYAEYTRLDDVILELNVTPNRADCLSHVGLARELGALLGLEVQSPKVHFEMGGHSVEEAAELELLSVDLCPRYAGCLIKGVKVGESPDWMKARLEAVGIHSINNVVDVTNYVMMELGQPLHAFDIRFIEGQKILVERSKKGEEFTSLDGTKIELTGSELAIRDKKKVIALAGIIGGLNSGVVQETTDIFIESAHFTPKTVRSTSRRLGFQTDSAYRFARGTDPQGVKYALQRSCHLIQKMAGGEVSCDFYDEYPEPIVSTPVAVRYQTLEDRLGYPVSKEDFHLWMKSLGCEFVKTEDFSTTLRPPSYRWDLKIEMDFVEEYARLKGYNKIPEHLPALVDPPSEHHSFYKTDRVLTQWMCEQGYFQAVNYHFIGESFLKSFLGDISKLFFYAHGGGSAHGCDGGTRDCVGDYSHHTHSHGLEWGPILVKNPLSEDTNAMRTMLLPGLMKNLLYNYRHGSHYGRLFELGKTFARRTDSAFSHQASAIKTSTEQGFSSQASTEKSLFAENHHLALLAWGQRETLWQKSSQRPVIYDLKSSMESLFSRLRSSSFQWRDIHSPPDFLHSGQCASLFFEGQTVGFIGTLHPRLKEEYKLRHDVAMGEFYVEGLMRGQPRKPKLKELSKYPAVERDFAFVLPDDLKVGDVIRHIQKSAGKELQSVVVFDDYRGSSVDRQDGHHSVAFRLIYQDPTETLSEKRLSELHQKLISAVTKKFSISTR